MHVRVFACALVLVCVLMCVHAGCLFVCFSQRDYIDQLLTSLHDFTVGSARVVPV